MKIVSTNISLKPTTLIWGNQTVETGIFKKPTKAPIYLCKENVRNDVVSDRKVHGGLFKACYLFSEEQYPYWKKLYPNLEWNYGMLGENLTVSGLDETKIYVGDIYKVGEAIIQITQPREPCFKFGLKFGSQSILKQFIAHGYPGTYSKVLEEGYVKSGDSFKLIKHNKNSLTIAELFQLLFAKEKNQELLKKAIANEAIPEAKRTKLAAFSKKA